MNHLGKVAANFMLLLMLFGMLMLPIGSMGLLTVDKNNVLSAEDTRDEEPTEYEKLFLNNRKASEQDILYDRTEETTSSSTSSDELPEQGEYIDYR